MARTDASARTKPTDRHAADLTAISTDLRQRAIHGVSWTFGSRVISQLAQFGATVVLARLLTPKDFGLYGMIVVITGFVTLLTELGLAAALVQMKSLEERHLSTAFWLNLASGIALSAVAVGVAPYVADFYGEPRLRYLMPVLGLTFALSFGVVQLALLERRLQFRRLAVIETIAAVAGTVAAVSAAEAGLGVWSLVVLPITSVTINSVLLSANAGWRPHVIFERQALRDLLRFGGFLTGFNATNYWSRNADNLLVGKILGATSLGFYGRAYALMLLPLSQISSVVSRVMLPALSSIQDDTERVKRAYLRANGMVALVAFPFVTLLFVTAPTLIDVLFGDRWAPTVPVLRWLCVAALPQTIGAAVGVLYQSQGRTDLQFRWGLATSSATVAAFGIGLMWGISGVAAAYAVRTYLLFYPSLWFPGRLVEMRPSEVFQTVCASLLGCAPLAVVAYVLGTALPADVPALAVLLVQGVSGVAVFCAAVHILRPGSLLELRGQFAIR